MSIIAGKAILGIVFTVLGAFLATHSRLSALSEWRFRLAVFAFWILTRVGLFAVVFLILQFEPTSDVVGAYVPQAHLAMGGLWIYRDFVSSYAPLFPYALAEALKYVWASSKMVVVLAMLVDLASLPFWMEALKNLLAPLAARQACVLYLASSAPLVNVALNGHNQVWVSLFVGVALWLYTRRAAAVSGFALSVPFVLVKFLALVTVPAFLPRNGRAFRFLASFAALPAAVYGFLVLHHVDVFVPVRNEIDARTSGNIPFLLTAALGRLRWVAPTRAIDGVALLALAALAVWLVSRQPAMPTPAVLWALNLLILTLLLVSRKSYTTYLVMCFFPLCAIAIREGLTRFRAGLFGIFGFVAMIEPTLWFRWLNGQQFLSLAPSVGVSAALWKVTLFLFTDLVLLAFYAYYWRESWLAFRYATRTNFSTEMIEELHPTPPGPTALRVTLRRGPDSAARDAI
jgi:hypothetical protein